MPPRTGRRAWEHLGDRELLQVRIRDLGVRLEESELPGRVAQLHAELEAAGLTLRPAPYLADEWLTPEGATTLGIPFYLAHPRLKALEFRMMFEVEGGNRTWCLRLLRHEAGHALDHAFRLHRRPDWHETFGSPRVAYHPELYLIDPRSRAHVRNLPDHYAQSHPEEDFAETFAVWLNPESQWRERYAGWPAMRKLRYVDRLMRALRGVRTPRRRPVLVAEARTLRATLGSYYRRKYRMYRVNDLGFTLPVLRRIFRPARAGRADVPAIDFIRRHRRELVASVAAWSRERPSRVAEVVAGLAFLADRHGLTLRGPEDAALVRFSTYATTLVVTRLHTHTYRLRKQP